MPASEPTAAEPAAAPAPLTAEEKAARAASFGDAAGHYERYRPGPPRAAVEWILPTRVGTAVDLGAGTGALSRLLVGRADEVIAVEPDDRMRAVLADAVPGVRAAAGRAESMPLPDASVDAVIASSSWHWVDLVPALQEVGRVLVPGGTLGALWSGLDPESAFIADATALLGDAGGGLGMGDQVERELSRAASDPAAGTGLEIPPGVPFDQPEHTVLRWEAALNADELIGLLGTFSWVILMEDDARSRLLETARRLLGEQLGVDGDATVELGFRADVWKARRRS
jgi:SAM-dependent methyltransferase